jgi:hypothetical protein
MYVLKHISITKTYWAIGTQTWVSGHHQGQYLLIKISANHLIIYFYEHEQKMNNLPHQVMK